MSENVLEALAKLFAITTMQDGGTSDKERAYVEDYFQRVLDKASVPKYLEIYEEVGQEFKEIIEKAKQKEYEQLGDKEEGVLTEKIEKVVEDKVFMRFSVRALKMCKQINENLDLQQKVYALIRMFELVACDNNLSAKRMEVIDTAASALQLHEYFDLIKDFVLGNLEDLLLHEEVLIIASDFYPTNEQLAKHLSPEKGLKGALVFLRIPEVDIFFVRYIPDKEGDHEVVRLDTTEITPNVVEVFARGSIIRTQLEVVYYSEVVSGFMGKNIKPISFEAIDLEFRFKNGNIGVRNVNLKEGAGRLIAIMGASGAGKTTLLNVLSGLEKPYKGKVLLNGVDIHDEQDKQRIEGVIGYVAQDDLLIEELTVYQNLYYSTKLCFKDLSEQQLHERVMNTLANLGLEHIKDLKVGSVLQKTISGGQRKRLNIALELIREPSVLFLDEPTSGLSSRDSENVMDLLKELSLKGKLIFIVIHQPSSEIFKMFDKLLILDTGGYPVYYGNPIEAISYFRRKAQYPRADEPACERCANTKPEEIFDIIEERVVTEKGVYTNKRKRTPEQWHEEYLKEFGDRAELVERVNEPLPKALNLPGKVRQTIILATRDFLSKVSNRQYVAINLLEAPLLAFLLSFVIRYQNTPEGEYVYRFNDNIPAYILICVLVALFMGLTVSAEEIIKDRKIRKREAFLNISKHSYLLSKVLILFTLSAIQTLSFVLIGNAILEVQGMTWTYWLVLFSVSCFANMLGLNISNTFNSVVTVYITIPLLLIPQMILSGIIFNFNKLNTVISEKGRVPLLADLMVSRWGFEAIAVRQFKENPYEKHVYQFDKEESIADYRRSFWLEEMREVLGEVEDLLKRSKKSSEAAKELREKLHLLASEIEREQRADTRYRYAREHRPETPYLSGIMQALTSGQVSYNVLEELQEYFNVLEEYYKKRFNIARRQKELFLVNIESQGVNIDSLSNLFYNDALADLAKNANMKDKIEFYKGKFLQHMDPIFQDPTDYKHALDYRAHFMAPRKHFFGRYFDTYHFDVAAIWILTILLYFTLYTDFFNKLPLLKALLEVKFFKKE
ncbi:ABC-type multidrug transport system ATPase subunit [Thermonema lapsum]|uniref:ABC-type multidrug transport system ATPase subunit n=1 Tax=Thermonema lapsum TaxID=28195 RepID=A0A846MQ69_9BACT|nr:ATP-binding cassette domain-containing protein [Thermonema lapsum]NIK73724.1 ABC-type multidrug transport system ATPase subunit [Thermonema lapsum]